MSRASRVAVLNCPLWTHLTPSYTVALLGAQARARGFDVVFPELEVKFFHAVTAAEQERWEPINTTYWDRREQTEEFYDKYAESFFVPQLEALLAAGVDTFALSVNNRALSFTRRLARTLKGLSPSAHLIVGGPTAFAAPERLWEIEEVDAVCLGEGDLCFPDYLTHLREEGAPAEFPGFTVRRPDGSLAHGGPPEPPRQLGELPFPDYSGYDLSLYGEPHTLATSISRGCIQRCTYCAESPHFGRFRYRGGENLFSEIDHHFRTTGLPRINLLLNDSVINGNVEALESFADHLLAARLPVTFNGMAVARDSLTRELLDKLKRAGCNSLSFGIESGSQQVLQLMNKRLQTPESAGRVLCDAREAGIETTVFIIVGFPGETEREFYETVGFLRRNFDHIDRLMVNKLLLLPGSKLSENPAAFGLDPEAAGDQFRTSDGSSTAEIRRLRQEMLYLLFQEKMALLQPLGGEGANPVARLNDEKAQLLEQSRRFQQDIISLKQKCHLLLGMLAEPGSGGAGAGRAAA